MEENKLERLKEIVKIIEEEIQTPNLNFSPDQILETAEKIYVHENIGREKNGKPAFKPTEVELATEKQRNFMKNLNIAYSGSTTKQEARQAIDEKLNK